MRMTNKQRHLQANRMKGKVNQILSQANLMLTVVERAQASKMLQAAKRLQTQNNRTRIKAKLRPNQFRIPN
jgi:hypothetical protein